MHVMEKQQQSGALSSCLVVFYCLLAFLTLSLCLTRGIRGAPYHKALKALCPVFFLPSVSLSLSTSRYGVISFLSIWPVVCRCHVKCSVCVNNGFPLNSICSVSSFPFDFFVFRKWKICHWTLFWLFLFVFFVLFSLCGLTFFVFPSTLVYSLAPTLKEQSKSSTKTTETLKNSSSLREIPTKCPKILFIPNRTRN